MEFCLDVIFRAYPIISYNVLSSCSSLGCKLHKARDSVISESSTVDESLILLVELNKHYEVFISFQPLAKESCKMRDASFNVCELVSRLEQGLSVDEVAKIPPNSNHSML